ncbi:MAG: hypothetical protein O9341_10635, partial [Paucibacter sp.]|nr:hypothetical protein [Roseateles sp.]
MLQLINHASRVWKEERRVHSVVPPSIGTRNETNVPFTWLRLEGNLDAPRRQSNITASGICA